jgi:hypothetical protein
LTSADAAVDVGVALLYVMLKPPGFVLALLNGGRAPVWQRVAVPVLAGALIGEWWSAALVLPALAFSGRRFPVRMRLEVAIYEAAHLAFGTALALAGLALT